MLYIVATPVGNLEDISARAIRILAEADGIACEDTRRTRGLLSHLKIPRPSAFMSYRQGIESKVGRQLLGLLEKGRNIAVCSDGGYPGISDPGYRVITAALEAGIEVEVIPGPSAVPVALLQSGLPTSSYTFKGYPPRKPGGRRSFFENESNMPHTLVLFESPYRVSASLEAALSAMGDRKAAVCIELTKKFERVSRGYLSDLVDEFDDVKIRGEVTIVIAGNNPKFRRKIDSQ